jgi:hypothetical protein
MSKNKNESKQYSPKEVADKLKISPQAIIKKIQNSLKAADNPTQKVSNCLPEGLTVSKFGRFFVITASPDYRFPRNKKNK